MIMTSDAEITRSWEVGAKERIIGVIPSPPSSIGFGFPTSPLPKNYLQ